MRGRRTLGLGGAAVVVAGSVLLSRILGLVREGLLAGSLGVNVDGDLYRQAFAIPDFLNYLMAGGYLTITLIPILSRHLAGGDEPAANRAFTSVFRFMAIAIVTLTGILVLAAAPIVNLVFVELGPEQQRELTALTRIVLPAQVFLVLGSLFMAAQYARRRFLFPALAPLVYNLGIILGGITAAAMGDSSPRGFLLGAVAGSVVGNFGLQWWGAHRTGTRLLSPVRGRSSVGEYLLLALPLMLGQSVAVLDEQFIRWFGQIQEGATSGLSFARHLNMVPVGVIAQAAGVAAYPFLARLAAEGKDDELADTTGRAAAQTLFIAAAAAAVTIAIARPLVRIILEYGAFTSADTEQVSSLLMILALSIPAWGLHQILSRHFYAKRRMWMPVLIGTAATAAAVPAWLGLYRDRGVSGFALASTLVMIGYALAMLVAWGADVGRRHVFELVPSLARGGIAALAAGVAGSQAATWVTPEAGFGPARGIAAVAIGAVVTLGVFVGIAVMSGSPEWRRLVHRQS